MIRTFDMRNFSILVVMLLATYGFWVLTAVYFISPLLVPRASYRMYFGLGTIPDILELIIFGAWAFFVARIGWSFFSGSSASRYRVALVALTVFFFCYTRGIFIQSNYRFEFVVRVLILTSIIAACAWFGLRCGPISGIARHHKLGPNEEL